MINIYLTGVRKHTVGYCCLLYSITKSYIITMRNIHTITSLPISLLTSFTRHTELQEEVALTL